MIFIKHWFWAPHLEEDQVRSLELVPVAGEDAWGHGALLPQELSSEMWAVRLNINPEYETLVIRGGSGYLPPLTPPQPPSPLHTRMVLSGTFSGSAELWFCPSFEGMNISWSGFRGEGHNWGEDDGGGVTYYSVFVRVFLRKQAPRSIFWVWRGFYTPCLHEVWKILWYHEIWAL